MSGRPRIPAEIEREILIESGHRCAVCGASCPLERAHIVPWRKSREHKAEDMICLCADCHGRADKENWGEKTLREYKQNPWVMRQYGRADTLPKNIATLTLTIEDIPEFDERDQCLLTSAIAGLLGIPPHTVRITSIKRSSIEITVELPAESAEKLLTAYKQDDPELRKFLAPFVLLDLRRETEDRETELNEFFIRYKDRGETAMMSMSTSLGQYAASVDKAMADLEAEGILVRILDHDHNVWGPKPTGISDRLGWLHIARVMKQNTCYIKAVTDAVRADGYTHALLLGMGGSSLAPEVFRKTFGVKDGYLDLAVLDSTDPGAVLAHAERLEMERTLFIVATKSGSTEETLSFFRFFYNRVVDAVGADHAGEHFVAITDPGTGLVDLARKHRFRDVFLNDPTIGGRYSALSYFGLVPAMLVGVDVGSLLDRATDMMESCKSDNTGARLGAIMGALATAGRDKLTLITSPPISAFGAWVEQLIAESTGKEGKGILPVDGEELGPSDVYGQDRLFVYLRLAVGNTYDNAVKALRDQNQPVVQIDLQDPYDLGGEFFRWEFATAVAGHILGINPFDQPNVEAAKILAREMVSAYKEKGELPSMTPKLEPDGITVYATINEDSLEGMLDSFLKQAKPGDYVAIQAYVQPTQETSAALQQLRMSIRDHSGLATTVGYGPRFLHSTGQLHKGDAGKGLFIQLTADNLQDAAIPDEAGSRRSSISFGVLKDAQALGDLRALLCAWRRVIRFHLGRDVVSGIRRMIDFL